MLPKRCETLRNVAKCCKMLQNVAKCDPRHNKLYTIETSGALNTDNMLILIRQFRQCLDNLDLIEKSDKVNFDVLEIASPFWEF